MSDLKLGPVRTTRWRSRALAAALAVTASFVAPLADATISETPVEARRESEAEHLLTAHADTWVAEIAGFNRRNTLCAPEVARAADAFDSAHRTRFKRTLGWRFDAAGARWIAASPARAEVTLVFSGPVRSGVVTIDGKTVAFCRAEAPDVLETFWSEEPRDGGVTRIGTSLPLPALPPGFEPPGVAPPPAALDAPTARAEVDARIAKAATMLAQDVAGLDAFLSASRAASICTEDKAREDAKRWAPSVLSRTRTRTDGPVRVQLKGASEFGPLKQGDRTIFVCGAFSRDVTIEATATWQAEGDDELSFSVDAQGKP